MKLLVYIFIFWIVSLNSASGDDNSLTEKITSQNPVFLQNRENTILDTVIVRGMDMQSGNELDSIILSRKGGILNEGLIEHDVNALADFLQKQGWWKAHVSASVDTSQGKPVILTYTVDKGKPAILGKLLIHSEETIPDFLTVPETEFYGKHFTHQFLEQIAHDIVSEFAANGYPDVVLTPSLIARDDTVDVSLMIHSGERATVDSIAIYGLSRTKDYVVRRELSHLYKRQAGQDVIGSARTVIGKINYITLAHDPYIDYTRESQSTLVLNLNEGRQGSFDGVVGYQPSSNGESGEIVGKIDLTFPNIMGTGRSSQIRWENLGKNTEDLELSYSEPWIFGFPYNIFGSFAQEQREKLDYTKTIIRTAVNRTIGHFHSSGGYRYEKVSSDSLNSSSAHGIDVGISWDSIDNPENPGSGILYSVRWSKISKNYRFGSKDSHSLERLEFNLDHYVPTFTRQTLAVLVRYRRIDTPTETLSLSDRYWLGGTTSIRGYREKIFPAVKALWATLEYRLIRGRASWIFAFIDSGYFLNRIKDSENHYTKKTMNRTGYGFGLRIESRAGTLGFDFGLGKGDSFGEGKFHVSLANSF